MDLLRTQRGGKKETKTVLPFINDTVVIPVCMFSNNIPPPMPWQVGLHYSFHVHAAPAVEALYPIPCTPCPVPYIPTRLLRRNPPTKKGGHAQDAQAHELQKDFVRVDLTY